MRSSSTRVSMMAVLAAAGLVAQVVSMSPIQSIDVRSFVQSKTQRADLVLRDFTHANGRWAVLVDFEQTAQSMIVVGTVSSSNLQASAIIEGHANRIALDAAGRSYLLMRPTVGGVSEIEVRDRDLALMSRHQLDGGLEPVFSGSDVLWLRSHGSSLFTSPLRLDSAGLGRAAESTDDFFALRSNERREATGAQPELRMVFGIRSTNPPKQRWIQLGNLSEDVVVVENDGTVISHAKAALDDAYRMAGLSVPERNSYSGRTLVGWAAVSQAGELYICLSSLPVRIPAQIAVIDAYSGRVLRVIGAQMPSSSDRVSQYNPAGNILPLKGAVDDSLMVFDGGAGILAIYSIH